MIRAAAVLCLLSLLACSTSSSMPPEPTILPYPIPATRNEQIRNTPPLFVMFAVPRTATAIVDKDARYVDHRAHHVRAWSVDDACEDATTMTMLPWKATPDSQRHVWANVTWDELKPHLDQAKEIYEQMHREPPQANECEASLAAYLEAIRFVAAHDELVLITYPPR